MPHRISVAGNIGVGKSTLVRLLSEQLGFEPFYEPVTENPYLADFYAEMSRWGFHSQLFFLATRLQIHRAALASPHSTIQDRSIYEDAQVFAANLFERGGMSARDYETYTALYQGIIGFLPPPDLVIYLQASPETLLQRIAQRARDYERSIDADYLSALNRLYDRWLADFRLCPVLTIAVDQLDVVRNPQHLQLICRTVQDKLSGQDTLSLGA